MNTTREWFATCPRGLAPLLATELAELGGSAVVEQAAGVSFAGPPSVMYRVCLWSRLANRVLLPLGEFPVTDADTLYSALRTLDWPAMFLADASFTVDFHGQSAAIRNTQFGAQRTKDAIVDAFRDAGGIRPAVDRQSPDIRVSVQLGRGRVRVALDMSGGSLHERGYRGRTGEAPLKENLAAAVLVRAGWPERAAAGDALIDPMCGSGTLLIEGALMAADVAPALRRKQFGFTAWREFDESQWRAVLGDARLRAERGLAGELPEIRGYDADPRVIVAAQESIAGFGLERLVRVTCKALAEVAKPTHRPLPRGLLVCNAPYGERIGEKHTVVHLYRRLGQLMHDEFQGWEAAVLAGDLEQGRATGLRSYKQYALYNGALPVSLLLFELSAENRLRHGDGDRPSDAGLAGSAAPELSPGAIMFANRMRKNRKRLRSWQQKNQIEAYRIYDADMPEYAVAVDVYGDWLHVAEYAAPKHVNESDAAQRMDEVKAALPSAMEIAPERIVYKRRERQRGAAQYQRRAVRGELLQVREGRANLLVNLHDYLDTGLFLDHRPLRLRLAEEANGRDFLNLFCYTGSATVHAALGGARSTTSVDMSNTYLDWLRGNFAANGLGEGRNRLLRADAREWLRDAECRYDLILLDPPSFSNSKRMQDSFDLQRDHVPLVEASLRCLRPGGVLYFSTNRRKFQLDPSLSEVHNCRDITADTLDPDFARRPGVHSCFRFSRDAVAGVWAEGR